MSMTVELHGFKEMADQLVQFPAKFARRALARSVYSGAAILRSKAKEKALAIGLKDKGDLVKSIRVKKLRTRNWKTSAVYGLYHSKRGFYGQFYERGFDNPSGKRTQRPHMRPALDENVNEITEAIRKRMAEEIEKLMPHLVKRF